MRPSGVLIAAGETETTRMPCRAYPTAHVVVAAEIHAQHGFENAVDLRVDRWTQQEQTIHRAVRAIYFANASDQPR